MMKKWIKRGTAGLLAFMITIPLVPVTNVHAQDVLDASTLLIGDELETDDSLYSPNESDPYTLVYCENRTDNSIAEKVTSPLYKVKNHYGYTTWTVESIEGKTISLINKPPYSVTVTNGKATLEETGTEYKKFLEGDRVKITADAPAIGKKFEKWEFIPDSITVSIPSNPQSYFTMPANDVKVTATYCDTVYAIQLKAKTAIDNMTVSNDTTADDILAVVNEVIKGSDNKNVTASWERVPAFSKEPATSSAEGSIKGTIQLRYKTAYTTTTLLIDVNKTIEKITEPAGNIYTYTEGARSQWTQESGKEMTFRVDCERDKFLRVKINGNILDDSNYTVGSGSTVVTLKPEYLKTLKPGTYNLSVEFTDGKADTTFTIQAKGTGTTPVDNSKPSGAGTKPSGTTQTASKKDNASPRTGDTTNAAGLFVLLALSGGTVVTVMYKRRKYGR